MKLFLSLFLLCSIAPAQVYTAFGDSITDTGVACGDADSASHCYADLIAASYGWILNNQGIGGSQAADESRQVYKTLVPDYGSPKFTYMIGTNDAWGYGTDVNRQAIFQAVNLSDLAYLAIPESHKIRETDWRIQYAGYGWYQGSLYNSTVAICGAPGASATASLSGSVIYISAGMQDGDHGQFAISVDGQQAGIYQAYGKNGAAIKTVVYGTTAAPQLIRIPVTRGQHTVTITSLGGGNLFFDWIASNAAVDTVNGPLVVAAAPPLQRTDNGLGGFPASELQQYADLVKANVQQLAADGLNVVYADTFDAFQNRLDVAITNAYDDVHPSDFGHQLLAQAFETAFAGALTPPATGQLANGLYRIKNAYSQLVMDDPNWSTAAGTQPIQWWDSGQNNQKWVFSQIPGTPAYTIQNFFSGLYLQDANGTLIEALPAASDAQKWTLKNIGPNTYVLINQLTGRVMDDANWSAAAGNGMITWSATGGINQEWVLEE